MSHRADIRRGGRESDIRMYWGYAGHRPENGAVLALSDYYRSMGDLRRALELRRQYVFDKLL